MVVLNDLDRFHLVCDVIDRVLHIGAAGAYAKQAIREQLIDHKEYIAEHGEDMPAIRNWRWSGGQIAARRGTGSSMPGRRARPPAARSRSGSKPRRSKVRPR
jgi:xylulose-5-phosphate/fructose-6-phosphate phosphoketolase